eukprot:scaffold1554_cov401-Prasinococcus_capsulatus_cf.AAC.8
MSREQAECYFRCPGVSICHQNGGGLYGTCEDVFKELASAVLERSSTTTSQSGSIGTVQDGRRPACAVIKIYAVAWLASSVERTTSAFRSYKSFKSYGTAGCAHAEAARRARASWGGRSSTYGASIPPAPSASRCSPAPRHPSDARGERRPRLRTGSVRTRLTHALLLLWMMAG